MREKTGLLKPQKGSPSARVTRNFNFGSWLLDILWGGERTGCVAGPLAAGFIVQADFSTGMVLDSTVCRLSRRKYESIMHQPSSCDKVFMNSSCKGLPTKCQVGCHVFSDGSQM